MTTLPAAVGPLSMPVAQLAAPATFASPLPTPEPRPAPLPIPEPTLGVAQTLGTVGTSGARLQSADKRVTLDLPANAVRVPQGRGTTARLMYTPRTSPQRVAHRGAAMRFDLNLKMLDDTDLPLAAPITLTLNVGDLLDLSPQPDRWPYLAYLDESTGKRVQVPVRADAQAGTLTASLPHFSAWETGMDGLTASGWRLLYNFPQTNLFSGAATYNYPIQVLPGRGGLQPDVALSYNSRRVDGLMSKVQSDWAGLGWAVSAIEIARQVGVECHWNSKKECWECIHTYRDNFTLMLNGASYRLVKDPAPPTAHSRYYTQDHTALYIERCNEHSLSSL